FPPPWVQVLMSPTGWEHYEHLCQEHGYQGQRPNHSPTPGATIQAKEDETRTASCHTEQAGGEGGFSDGEESNITSETPSMQEPCSHTSALVVSTETRQGQDTVEALAAEIGAEMGEPCMRCGCTLCYQSGPYVMCHQCHPRPVRLGGLNDEQW